MGSSSNYPLLFIFSVLLAKVRDDAALNVCVLLFVCLPEFASPLFCGPVGRWVLC